MNTYEYFQNESKKMGKSVTAFVKETNIRTYFNISLCKCDNGDYKNMVVRVLANHLGCERNLDAVKVAAQNWYKEYKKRESEKKHKDADRSEILKGDEFMSGLRTGTNGLRAKAEYADENLIKVSYITSGYARSCRFTKYEYFAKVKIKKGYTLHLIGGLYTIIKGDKVRRDGMKATGASRENHSRKHT